MTQEWSWSAFWFGVLASSVFNLIIIAVKAILSSVLEDR